MKLEVGKKYISIGGHILSCHYQGSDYFMVSPITSILVTIDNRKRVIFDPTSQFQMLANGTHRFYVTDLDIVAEYQPIKNVLPLPG